MDLNEQFAAMRAELLGPNVLCYICDQPGADSIDHIVLPSGDMNAPVHRSHYGPLTDRIEDAR